MENNKFIGEQLEKHGLLDAIYFIEVNGPILYKKDIPVRPNGVAKLKDIRLAKGIGLKELSRRINDGNPNKWMFIKAWEEEPQLDPTVHPHILESLCQALDVTPEQLNGTEPFHFKGEVIA